MALHCKSSLACLLQVCTLCILGHAYVPYHHPRRLHVWTQHARRQRPRDFYDEYEDDEDDYYYNDRSSQQVGFREINESVEQELRDLSMNRRERKNSQLRYNDDKDEMQLERKSEGIARRRDGFSDYYDEDDYEDYEDDSYYENEPDTTAPPAGNYWVNPIGGMDKKADQREGRRRRPRTPNKPTTFRSGFPEAPEPVSDLYNRLFWYGVDLKDTTSPADPTMFGGTKGKFNGLSIIQSSQGLERPAQRPRRNPRGRRRDDRRYFDDEDDLYDEEESRFPARDDPRYDEEKATAEPFSYPEEDDEFNNYSSYGDRKVSTDDKKDARTTPPTDPPLPREEERRRASMQIPRKGRPRRQRRPDYYADDRRERNSNSWFSSGPAANWFNDDEDERTSRQRGPREGNNEWSGFNFMDAFLGINRAELQRQARVYDESMGLGRGSNNSQRRRRRRSRDRPSRRGDTYRYVETEDSTNEPQDVIETRADTVSPAAQETSEDETPKVELSWEQRALAIDRVPPPDVPAWGPNGDLGIDARTKAITDALEDVAEARQKVEDRRRQLAQLKEDMTILRVNTELEKKNLSRRAGDPTVVREKIEALDWKVSQFSRKLRLAQIKVTQAQEELAKLQARHWAVLGCYSSEQAKLTVEDALDELMQQEPAVRRFYEKNKLVVQNESSATTPEGPGAQEETKVEVAPAKDVDTRDRKGLS